MSQEEIDKILDEEWIQTDEEAILYINNMFAAIDRGEENEGTEIESIAYRLIFLDGRKPELDIEFAKRFHQFPWLSDFGDEWQLHVTEIMAAEFPLDEIPEHVRGILENLYYK